MFPSNLASDSFEEVVDPGGTRRMVPCLDGVNLDRSIRDAARDALRSETDLLETFLRRLAYRPGWTFTLDHGPPGSPPAVRIGWETDDVRGYGKANLFALIHVDTMRHSLRLLCWEILGRIRELEDHERLELFRQGADRLFDPHPNGVELGTHAPRPEVHR